jgi:hypothetical protein
MEPKRLRSLIVVVEHPKIGWVLMAVGIAVATVGGFISLAYYSYLQRCAATQFPCPNYSALISDGFFVLGAGVVVLVAGILERWMDKRGGKSQ